jgi:hypothetical protein
MREGRPEWRLGREGGRKGEALEEQGRDQESSTTMHSDSRLPRARGSKEIHQCVIMVMNKYVARKKNAPCSLCRNAWCSEETRGDKSMWSSHKWGADECEVTEAQSPSQYL